jgi:hypothetical protein
MSSLVVDAPFALETVSLGFDQLRRPKAPHFRTSW